MKPEMLLDILSNMQSFEKCLSEAAGEPELVQNFERLYGVKFHFSRSPIEKMVDQACDFNPNEEAMRTFVKFVYDCIWIRLPKEVRENL